jgi:cell division septum initiation protein DivIVA
MSTIKTFHAAFANVMSERATTLTAIANEAAERYAQTNETSDKRAMQRAATHAKRDASLAGLSADQLALAHKLKLEPAHVEAQSREFKKRLELCLVAIASGQRVKDRALDSVLQYLAAKGTRDLSFSAIMREAGHETNTQARYMLRFFRELRSVATVDNSTRNVSFTLRDDCAVLNALLGIYTAK